MEIGVVADTHGYLNPNVFTALEGVDRILHAGDIGSEDVITSLEALAPVQAIYGNIDSFPLIERYPASLTLEIAGRVICMVHELGQRRDSEVARALGQLSRQEPDLVIYGHTHQAKLERRGEVLLFNPGSAGRRRFSLRPAVGRLHIPEGVGGFTPEIIYLD